MTSIRWGFLGASRIGRGALAPAVRDAQGHVLHAVAARDPRRAESFAADTGAARAYGSYEELLRDPDVDAIYNPLTNDRHLPVTLQALEAGKHVLTEKPLALNAGEVRAMRDASERTGRLVLEAFAYRFHPQVDRARNIIQEGRIGNVRVARAAFCFTLDRPDDFRWTPGMGGGALYDVGCYCVNSLRLVLNREPLRVAAFQHEVNGVDATLSGALDFGNGVSGHFDCSMEGAYNQSLTVVGSEGILTLSVPFGSKDREVTLTYGESSESFAVMDPYRTMVEHFGRAMRGEEPLRYTLDDAERQARVLDALFASAREGGVREV